MDVPYLPGEVVAEVVRYFLLRCGLGAGFRLRLVNRQWMSVLWYLLHTDVSTGAFDREVLRAYYVTQVVSLGRLLQNPPRREMDETSICRYLRGCIATGTNRGQTARWLRSLRGAVQLLTRTSTADASSPDELRPEELPDARLDDVVATVVHVLGTATTSRCLFQSHSGRREAARVPSGATTAIQTTAVSVMSSWEWALLTTCYRDSAPQLITLLSSPSHARRVQEGKNAALHLAAQLGRPKMAKILLENTADVNSYGIHYPKDTNHSQVEARTPLEEACSAGHHDVVYQLLDACDMLPATGAAYEHAMRLAARGRLESASRADIVRLLLPEAHLTAERGRTLRQDMMIQASARGHVGIVQYLLEYDDDESMRRDNTPVELTTALWYSALAGHVCITKLICRYGQWPDTVEEGRDRRRIARHLPRRRNNPDTALGLRLQYEEMLPFIDPTTADAMSSRPLDRRKDCCAVCQTSHYKI